MLICNLKTPLKRATACSQHIAAVGLIAVALPSFSAELNLENLRLDCQSPYAQGILIPNQYSFSEAWHQTLSNDYFTSHTASSQQLELVTQQLNLLKQEGQHSYHLNELARFQADQLLSFGSWQTHLDISQPVQQLHLENGANTSHWQSDTPSVEFTLYNEETQLALSENGFALGHVFHRSHSMAKADWRWHWQRQTFSSEWQLEVAELPGQDLQYQQSYSLDQLHFGHEGFTLGLGFHNRQLSSFNLCGQLDNQLSWRFGAQDFLLESEQYQIESANQDVGLWSFDYGEQKFWAALVSNQPGHRWAVGSSFYNVDYQVYALARSHNDSPELATVTGANWRVQSLANLQAVTLNGMWQNNFSKHWHWLVKTDIAFTRLEGEYQLFKDLLLVPVPALRDEEDVEIAGLLTVKPTLGIRYERPKWFWQASLNQIVPLGLWRNAESTQSLITENKPDPSDPQPDPIGEDPEPGDPPTTDPEPNPNQPPSNQSTSDSPQWQLPPGFGWQISLGIRW